MIILSFFSCFVNQREGKGSSFFRHTGAIIFLYDETDASSFDEIGNWVDEASRWVSGSPILFLIGNKNDLICPERPLAVSQDRIHECANMLMAKPLYISAKTGDGCEEALEFIVRELIE